MKVYFNSNFFNHNANEKVLKEIPLKKEFTWEETNGLLPALYIGEEGIVIDVCICVPVDKIQSFYEKWDLEKSVSELSDEDNEQMIRENPFNLNYNMDMVIDGERLLFDGACGLVWHPLKIEEEQITEEAKELMKYYECNQKSGWYFERRVYHWNNQMPEKIDTMELMFQINKTPCSGEHFITEAGCEEKTLELIHPVTGQGFTLTIHGYEPDVMRGFEIPHLQDMELPTRYHSLSYSLSPELSQEDFRIQDCCKSDQPRKVGGCKENEKENTVGSIAIIGGAEGPSAIFIAGRYKEDVSRYTTCSSLHFDKRSQVEWRPIFYVKEREDFSLAFSIGCTNLHTLVRS